MPLRDRNAYSNLLLLCVPHHTQVDHEEDGYPADLLRKWKTAREKDLAPDLNTISNLTQEMLQDVIKDAIGEVSDRLESAVKKLEVIAPELAETVATFVDTVGVSSGPMMDPDVIAWAHEASQDLRHLEDTAPMLATAADRLRDLPGTVDVLSSVVADLVQSVDAMKDVNGY